MSTEEHVETLRLLCDDAKAISRRGLTGTRTAEYADLHAAINDELEAIGV